MGLTTVRYVIPAVLVIAGFVILFVADDSLRWDGWAMCVGAGLALLLLNVLYRYGAQGDRERDAEEAAREYFAKHGRWPDEQLSAGGPQARGQRRRERNARDERGLKRVVDVRLAVPDAARRPVRRRRADGAMSPARDR